MRTRMPVFAFLFSLAFALPAACAQAAGPQTRTQSGWQTPPAERGPWQGPMRGGGWRAPGRMGWMGGGMRGRGPMAGSMLLRLVNSPEMRQRLNITPEQAGKIRQQASEFLKGQIRNRAELEIQRLDLRNQLAADHPDRAAIDATLQKMSDLRLAQEKSAVDFRLAMRDAFTPEQRQKLLEMRRAWMRERFGGRMMMHGPHRPAPMGRPGAAPSGTGPGGN